MKFKFIKYLEKEKRRMELSFFFEQFYIRNNNY